MAEGTSKTFPRGGYGIPTIVEEPCEGGTVMCTRTAVYTYKLGSKRLYLCADHMKEILREYDYCGVKVDVRGYIGTKRCLEGVNDGQVPIAHN